jgi:hypothetical protein
VRIRGNSYATPGRERELQDDQPEPEMAMVSRCVSFVLVAAAAGVALAQQPGDRRGSTPPGMSQDGSRPGDGAIKGGAITPDGPAGTADVNRCKELEGVLREQCLRDLASSAGKARPPGAAPPASVGRDPITDPPPQNPLGR